MAQTEKAVTEILNMLNTPALTEDNGIVLWCNDAAQKLLLQPGDQLSDLFRDYHEVMDDWDGGTELHGSLRYNDCTFGLTARALDGQTVLLLEPEESAELSQCVIQSVLRGIGPSVDHLLHSLRALIPELEEQENDRLQAVTSEIIHAGYSLKRTAAALDHLSHLQDENIRLNRESIELYPFFCDLAEKEADILQECGVRLDSRITMNEYAIGDIDRNVVERIVACLLSNAVKFGDRKKTIVLQAELKAPFVYIRVRNCGAPMDDETLSAAFSQFTQPPNENVPNRGIGIGLALVRMLARQHGGGALLQSDAQATVVTVSLNVTADINSVTFGSSIQRHQTEAIDPSLVELSDQLPDSTFDSRNVDF